MTTEYILFFGLAIVAVLSALGMLLSSNAIYSALYLILNFITVAVFYLILDASFIALTQVTVYAGAIMVLFLFVIMLLGVERLRTKSKLPWQQFLAVVLGAILLVEVGYLILTRSGVLQSVGETSSEFGTPALVGEVLFNQYLLPFEVTSILLLVAIIGAIILTRMYQTSNRS